MQRIHPHGRNAARTRSGDARQDHRVSEEIPSEYVFEAKPDTRWSSGRPDRKIPPTAIVASLAAVVLLLGAVVWFFVFDRSGSNGAPLSLRQDDGTYNMMQRDSGSRGSVSGAADNGSRREALPVAAAVPGNQTLLALIRSTMISFDQGNRTKNYSVFYGLTTDRFRASNSVDDVFNAFESWREPFVNLASLAILSPTLVEQPKVDDSGILRLKGYFPTQPERVVFSLGFFLSEEGWLLDGLVLDLVRAAEDEEELEQAPERQ